MQIIKEKLSNGNTITYQIVNGTAYHVETCKAVVDALERARADGTRIVLDYGNVLTGESWNESHDIKGRLGRSGGSIKVPILLHNSRSIGGGAILDHCIIAIRAAKGGAFLYLPTYPMVAKK